VAVASGDEDRAVARLRAALAEHPLDGGRTRVAWRSAVALVYVFAPEQRPELDSLDGPAGVVWARSLARAVLAGREEGHADPIDTVDVRCPNRVRAALPVPLVVELAVRLHGAGRVTDALSLLEPLGEAGRARLRGLGTPAAKSMLAAVPAAPVVPLRVRALGALRVDGRTLDRVRVRELLGFLLLHRSTTRTAVTVALWPDLDDRAAANNLRVTLSHLLRVLEPERADGEAAYSLRVAGPDLRLVAGRALDVDLDAFDAHIAAAAEAERDGTLSIALERYAAAADLFEGELLADLPDVAWADIERERCRARFVAAAVRAGELLTAAGELDRAERLARRALEVDEWSEPAYAVLTSTALARGDRSAARRLLERCQEMLRELGVEPSMATGQLARRVRSA
jgi:DNA-binding SARP family transcriptional activator